MRHRLGFLIAGVAFVLAASPVLAGGVSLSALHTVSGATPFAACTVGASGAAGEQVYPGAEPEVFVATDPTDGNDLIATYQQDRWSTGGARGLGTGYSTDGGSTWSQVYPPFSRCASVSSAYDRATDPWVTYAPNGHAYQISLSLDASLTRSAILVSKSTDDGATWSTPTVLIDDEGPFGLPFHDKQSITADPNDANYVYAVWDVGAFPDNRRNLQGLIHSFAYRQAVLFSRTTNGGATWEPVTEALRGEPNVVTLGNQIAVRPQGTLIDVFWYGKGAGIQPSWPYYFGIIRSDDRGRSWSRIYNIAKDFSVGAETPDGDPIRGGDIIPDIAVDPNSGKLFVVWMDSRFAGGARNDIVMSTSTDGGLHWTAPVKVSGDTDGTDAFSPSVEVNGDGVVAVSYYDMRNDTGTGGASWTDHWLRHSHDGGATWSSDARLTTASFDIETAPVARGLFLGDYVGLAADSQGDFHSVFVVADGDATSRTTTVVHREVDVTP